MVVGAGYRVVGAGVLGGGVGYRVLGGGTGYWSWYRYWAILASILAILASIRLYCPLFGLYLASIRLYWPLFGLY